MSAPDSPTPYALTLVRVTVARPMTHTLEEAARLAGVHPEMLRHYCRLGLFGAAHARPGAELLFDDDALYELRRHEHYRRRHGVDRRTLRLLCALWREVERLQRELRSRHGG
jgi:DNA-binding transcriptional MerR regulator